jgi:hypothetical protein
MERKKLVAFSELAVIHYGLCQRGGGGATVEF